MIKNAIKMMMALFTMQTQARQLEAITLAKFIQQTNLSKWF